MSKRVSLFKFTPAPAATGALSTSSNTADKTPEPKASPSKPKEALAVSETETATTAKTNGVHHDDDEPATQNGNSSMDTGEDKYPFGATSAAEAAEIDRLQKAIGIGKYAPKEDPQGLRTKSGLPEGEEQAKESGMGDEETKTEEEKQQEAEEQEPKDEEGEDLIANNCEPPASEPAPTPKTPAVTPVKPRIKLAAAPSEPPSLSTSAKSVPSSVVLSQREALAFLNKGKQQSSLADALLSPPQDSATAGTKLSVGTSSKLKRKQISEDDDDATDANKDSESVSSSAGSTSSNSSESKEKEKTKKESSKAATAESQPSAPKKAKTADAPATVAAANKVNALTFVPFERPPYARLKGAPPPALQTQLTVTSVQAPVAAAKPAASAAKSATAAAAKPPAKPVAGKSGVGPLVVQPKASAQPAKPPSTPAAKFAGTAKKPQAAGSTKPKPSKKAMDTAEDDYDYTDGFVTNEGDDFAAMVQRQGKKGHSGSVHRFADSLEQSLASDGEGDDLFDDGEGDEGDDTASTGGSRKRNKLTDEEKEAKRLEREEKKAAKEREKQEEKERKEKKKQEEKEAKEKKKQEEKEAKEKKKQEEKEKKEKEKEEKERQKKEEKEKKEKEKKEQKEKKEREKQEEKERKEKEKQEEKERKKKEKEKEEREKKKKSEKEKADKMEDEEEDESEPDKGKDKAKKKDKEKEKEKAKEEKPKKEKEKEKPKEKEKEKEKKAEKSSKISVPATKAPAPASQLLKSIQSGRTEVATQVNIDPPTILGDLKDIHKTLDFSKYADKLFEDMESDTSVEGASKVAELALIFNSAAKSFSAATGGKEEDKKEGAPTPFWEFHTYPDQVLLLVVATHERYRKRLLKLVEEKLEVLTAAGAAD